MDTAKRLMRMNPREGANIISVLFWTWTVKFFKVSTSKVLAPGDLYDPLTKDGSDVLGDRLERHWNQELAKCRKYRREPSLWKTLLRCFLPEFIFLGVLHTINKCLRLSIPIVIGNLLVYFKEDTDMEYSTALLYATTLCLSNFIYLCSKNHELFEEFHIGAKIRTALCSVIYRKVLRLSTTSFNETASGKVVNLIANDVSRFDMVIIFIPYMWSALIVTAIVGYFSYVETGYAGLIGFATILVFVPIQSYTAKLSAKFRSKTLIRTDERVQLMDEIISGVQVIKMYVWEKAFCSLIAFIRKMELRMIRNKYWVYASYMTCFLFSPRLGLYMTLITMMLSGQYLPTEKVFIFFSYFVILGEVVGASFVRGITEIAETLVAIGRLQEFLMYDECDTGYKRLISGENCESSTLPEKNHCELSILSNKNHCGAPQLPTYETTVTKSDSIIQENHKGESEPDGDNIVVRMTNLTATWKSENSSNILENVNVTLQEGKMNIVIGPVGAGKSSLIYAMLGEIPISNGEINIKGKISYASQESWIFGSTVRKNIIFDQPYDHLRYQEVIKACALVRDFEGFPEGDQTPVGEHGSSLSGGQKARINMARAVYRKADVYIFDDPLSAVDTHVSNHLFKECLERYLMGKTRILVTHQLQYVKAADTVLLIEQKKVRQFPSFSKFMESCPAYYKLVTSESLSPNDDDSAATEKRDTKEKSPSKDEHQNARADVGNLTDNQNPNVNDNLEDSSGGTVKGSIMAHYFRAGGNWCFIVLVGSLCVLSQCTLTINDMYFPMLMTAEEKRFNAYETEKLNNSTADANDGLLEPAYEYIYIYTAIVLSILVVGLAQAFTFYQLCLNANQNLHDRAFDGVIRAGMQFFDTNPSGRILNRFSKDINTIDELLARTLHEAELIILIASGSIVIVCIVNPFFIIPLVILTTGAFWLMRLYVKAATNVRRLEGGLKSPVFTYLNTTLKGLITIRTYGAQSILTREFDVTQDNHSSAWYMFIVTNAAFGFFLDCFCSTFITVVIFSLLIINGYSRAEVGLAITVIISMTGMIRWGMRQSTEVVNQMTCVERILEYSLLEPEDKACLDGTQDNLDEIVAEERKLLINSGMSSLENWPNSGRTEFRNVCMRYDENEPPILNDLNAVIKANEKVGIVGRSGAGKSSLISALFRLRNVEGMIKIDDVNTGKISLQNLRKNISIIPQNPVLFSGTVRKNLDPFNECTDGALWTVLEEVELKETVNASGPNGLENRVLQRGANYSAGQKQLICLARAILRNNKILILDEATANVDPHTDELIQRAIRTKFSSCTVLTVAHRLNTIMDSDRVLVMDRGEIMEFDHPFTLLQNQHGHFTSLVKETGHEMYEQLYSTAKQSYDNRVTE